MFAQNYNDATLARVRQMDTMSRDAQGKLITLPAAEHSYRADVYAANRVFPNAREHWDKLLKNYPNDPLVPKALFGIGRAYMWEREYDLALTFFDQLTKNYLDTKDGREGLAFKGACLVRLGKSKEAAQVYEQYTVMFPTGERVDSAYLNIIDALREAGKYDDATNWVLKTRQRFSNTAIEANAVFAQLRMEIGRKNWQRAILVSDDLRLLKLYGSMTNAEEATFLKAYALEKIGRRDEAFNLYLALPNNLTSYYGAQATERLNFLASGDAAKRSSLANRTSIFSRLARSSVSQFPAPFQGELLRNSKPRKIDPRFVLAIMKQESSFRANAKSPSAARGLLQMTLDTAQKYVKQTSYTSLKDADLYLPEVSISLGSIYLAELQKEFPNLPEAVAASYNGGEDNAARWLKRADTRENFIFASEVGFAETKEYVSKVMTNYRVYRELYTEDLRRK